MRLIVPKHKHSIVFSISIQYSPKKARALIG